MNESENYEPVEKVLEFKFDWETSDACQCFLPCQITP